MNYELLIKLLLLLINSRDAATIAAVLAAIEVARELLAKAKNGEPVTSEDIEEARKRMKSAVAEWDAAVATTQGTRVAAKDNSGQ